MSLCGGKLRSVRDGPHGQLPGMAGEMRRGADYDSGLRSRDNRPTW